MPLLCRCHGHPAMAPRPLSSHWHLAMAPCNGTTSTPPKLVNGTSTRPSLAITLPPNHSTLQWHPTMAPSNGATSTPPKLVVTLPPNHSKLQWHPTIAPSNGPTSTAPCSGTLVPRPIRQSGSSPCPPIGSKNPYSYRCLGNNYFGDFFFLVGVVSRCFQLMKKQVFTNCHHKS